jgi:hypothetical protein
MRAVLCASCTARRIASVQGLNISNGSHAVWRREESRRVKIGPVSRRATWDTNYSDSLLAGILAVNLEMNPKGQVPEDWSAHKKAKLIAYKGMPAINFYNG